MSAIAPDVIEALLADPGWRADAPIHAARAPGRLDWLGGIADYSGSLVLQLPLAQATTAAVQLADDDRIDLASCAEGEWLRWRGAWSELGDATDLAALRERLAGDWPAYVVGVAAVLAEWAGTPAPGFRARIVSDVPVAKGVSSSAAIEVASLLALARARSIDLDGRPLALLAQRAENRVVGAPCGVMDPMTAACGEADRLLALRCQPATIEGQLQLPPDLRLWAVDSGVRHAVSGADYGSVRCATFMGKKMLGLGPEKWLVDFDATNLREELERLPESIEGRAFRERWGDVDDGLSAIEEGRRYAVRACTAHPILEHRRIEEVARLLRTRPSDAGPRLGESMYASHASYSLCGLGSEATDAIVDRVRDAAARGVRFHGAKITGGGSGGTVAILGHPSAAEEVRRIADEQRARFGGGTLLEGSGDGAIHAPAVTLTPRGTSA